MFFMMLIVFFCFVFCLLVYVFGCSVFVFCLVFVFLVCVRYLCVLVVFLLFWLFGARPECAKWPQVGEHRLKADRSSLIVKAHVWVENMRKCPFQS